MPFETMLMHSVTIRTDCPEDSYDFYTGSLGLGDLTVHFGASPGQWWLGAQSVLIELQAHPEGDAGVEPGPLDNGLCQISMFVADLDHACEFLARRDERIIERPTRAAARDRRMLIAAPEGTLIQLHEPRLWLQMPTIGCPALGSNQGPPG